MFKIRDNRIIGIALVVTWLSYSVYLFPLPNARLANLPEQVDTTELNWLGDVEKENLQKAYTEMRQLVHLEWLVSLGITLVGIVAAIFAWRAVKFWRPLTMGMAVIYLGLWFLRYSGDPSRNALDAYIYHWKLAGYLGGFLPYVAVAYLDGVLVILQVILLIWFAMTYLKGSVKEAVP